MDRPGFYFCICPDHGLVRAHIEENLLTRGPEEKTGVFWGDEGLDRRFWSDLDMVSLDGSFHVLIVRQAQLLKADEWRALSRALGTPHASALPVICLECAWEKEKPKLPAHIAKSKCLEFARKKQWTWGSPGLDRKTVRPYLQAEMRRRGLSAGSDVLSYLAEIAIPDAFAVQTLFDQMELAAGDGRITMEIARGMAACAREGIVFDVVRHMEQGREALALKSLQSSGGDEDLLFPLLSLVARDARLLWQMRAGEQVYVPRYQEDEKRRLAERLGFDGIADILAAVADADMAVKSGEQKPPHALAHFIAAVSAVCARAQQEGHGGARR